MELMLEMKFRFRHYGSRAHTFRHWTILYHYSIQNAEPDSWHRARQVLKHDLTPPPFFFFSSLFKKLFSWPVGVSSPTSLSWSQGPSLLFQGGWHEWVSWGISEIVVVTSRLLAECEPGGQVEVRRRSPGIAAGSTTGTLQGFCSQ